MISRKVASMAENQSGDRVIQIEFSYDLDTLFKVRGIHGRKYHQEQNCWSAPLRIETAESLINWGFTLDDTLISFLNNANGRAKEITQVNGIPGLGGALHPFQSKGVSFVDFNNGRALIADEMGLGKTVQALAWLQLHPDKRPVIIATPASVKENWAREAKIWLPDPDVQILSGQTPYEITGEIIIINYDILVFWWQELKRLQPQVFITDECHFYKNNRARRTKAVKKLAKGIPHFIALSGTPIENKPVEIYNAWQIIDPINCPAWPYFTVHFCNARHTPYGIDVSGASNKAELHKKLVGSIMIRRLKKDVLPELPAKVHSFIPIKLSNEREYRTAEDDFISYVIQEKGVTEAEKLSNTEVKATIEELKQLAVKGKLKHAIEWIKDFLEIDGKLVLFTHHHFVLDAIMEEFKEIAVKYDGRMTPVQKEKAKDEFQTNSEIRLFVGNMQAAGVGINLTAASSVAFLELPWSPTIIDQCSDRCHRIGQKDTVNIYYLLATNTVEERIIRLLDSKRKVLDAVMDGKVTEIGSLLSELIKDYQQKRIS
jgi:SNF2 family DNA or RNA helicase